MTTAPTPPDRPGVEIPQAALDRIAAALEHTSDLRAAEVKARGNLIHGETRGRDLVAVILAAGVSVAVVAFVILAEVNLIWGTGNTLSENTTQVLIALFSGVVGGLAGYLGGRAESRREATGEVPKSEPPA